MVGSNPNEVTKLYHTIIGKPLMIPQWILGWNQCRWGYKNTTALRNAVKGYRDNGIPLDV
jgi:alpha-glucosidase (family GH31 glycosyl hydrolase)